MKLIWPLPWPVVVICARGEASESLGANSPTQSPAVALDSPLHAALSNPPAGSELGRTLSPSTAVGVAVAVGAGPDVPVAVAVGVAVLVNVAVGVGDAIGVGVAVGVRVGVCEGPGVKVLVVVAVGVGVPERMLKVLLVASRRPVVPENSRSS
jgi:hypothetical protein